MRPTMDGQIDAFDLLMALQPAPEPQPVGDVGTFLHPGDLEAMYDAKIAHHREFHVDKGSWKPYRGWSAQEASGKDSAHQATCYDAELRCSSHWGKGCQCVGSLVYRVYCHDCAHWTGIYDDGNKAWEAHLDHCWTGWRDLPVLESKPTGYSYKWNIPDGYPEKFVQPGAPIRDCRGDTKYGTRHVPGHSQYGGVKVGVTQDCKIHNSKRSER
ncbi:DUF6349 family protein [Glutamicibacter ardleyensis]|uniref:DUF6349 family protein n=1 Tax=Glutamicibacter ardleyensis TaxID=225894 RepID=UPI003FD23E98